MERERNIQKKPIGELTTKEISENMYIPSRETDNFYFNQIKEYQKKEKAKTPLIYKAIKKEDFNSEIAKEKEDYSLILAKSEKTIRKDRDEMLKQIERHPEAIMYVDESIKTADFIKEGITRNAQVFSYLTKEEKQDADYVRAYRDSLFSEKHTKFDYVTQDGIKGRQIQYQIDKDANLDVFFEKDAMVKAYDELIREPYERGIQRKASYMFITSAHALEKDNVEYFKEAARKYSAAIEQTIINYKSNNSRTHDKDILDALSNRDLTMRENVNKVHECAEILKNRTYEELEQTLSVKQNRQKKETPQRLQVTEEQRQVLDQAMEDQKLRDRIKKASIEYMKNEAKAIVYSEYLNGRCSQMELSESIGRIDSISNNVDVRQLSDKLATIHDVVDDYYNQKYGEEINGGSVYDKIIDKDRDGLPDYQEMAEDYSKAYHDDEYTHSPEEREMYHKYSYKG